MRKKYGKYFATMGLEIHVALQTGEKLFSSASNEFTSSQFAILDCGMPGAMPVLDSQAVEMAIAFGLGCQAHIASISRFDRKHYFYPDLPLGYQITQQHEPILVGGHIDIHVDGQKKTVDIEHAHLECDAAKSIHDLYAQYTAIDLSRCGSALLEVVSKPCMHTPQEARAYAREVYDLVRFMGICDGKMQEGSFRVDASISLSEDEHSLGTRVEIKNLSSFAFLQAALEYEIQRQQELLDRQEKVLMQTRLFDEKSMTTKAMREKETQYGYRYMPDPDIPALVVTQALIEATQNAYRVDFFMLRRQLQALFTQHGLELSDEQVVDLLSGEHKPLWLELLATPAYASEKMLRMMAFWLPEVMQRVNATRSVALDQLLVLAKSPLQAKEVKDSLSTWLTNPALSMAQAMPQFMPPEQLQALIEGELSKWPQQVQQAHQGNEKIVQFLTGKCMAQIQGKAAASMVKEMVIKHLHDAPRQD